MTRPRVLAPATGGTVVQRGAAHLWAELVLAEASTTLALRAWDLTAPAAKDQAYFAYRDALDREAEAQDVLAAYLAGRPQSRARMA